MQKFTDEQMENADIYPSELVKRSCEKIYFLKEIREDLKRIYINSNNFGKYPLREKYINLIHALDEFEKELNK